jgi:hypothetical protein
LLRKAVRAEYTLLRTPLTMLDEKVVSRYVPRDSVVQTSLARTISALDEVAERLLAEPSDVVASSAFLPLDEQEEIEELAEELFEAEEEQTFAGELADDEELRRVQAELRAKHTVEERDETS